MGSLEGGRARQRLCLFLFLDCRLIQTDHLSDLCEEALCQLGPTHPPARSIRVHACSCVVLHLFHFVSKLSSLCARGEVCGFTACLTWYHPSADVKRRCRRESVIGENGRFSEAWTPKSANCGISGMPLQGGPSNPPMLSHGQHGEQASGPATTAH